MCTVLVFSIFGNRSSLRLNITKKNKYWLYLNIKYIFVAAFCTCGYSSFKNSTDAKHFQGRWSEKLGPITSVDVIGHKLKFYYFNVMILNQELVTI